MQHLGLVAIGIYWGLVSYILYKWGVDNSKTISDHVATGKQKWLYTPFALLYLVLMTIFLFGWFLPAYDAKTYQYTLLFVGIFFLFWTFVLPRHGRTFLAHDIFSGIVGSVIFLLLSSILVGAVSGTMAVVTACGLLGMFTAGTLLVKKGRKRYIEAQIFYFAVFHALILLLTYTR